MSALFILHQIPVQSHSFDTVVNENKNLIFSKKLFCCGTGTVHNICLLGDSFSFHFLFVCLLSICSASTISSSYSFLASIFGGAREEKREREKERDRDRDRERKRETETERQRGGEGLLKKLHF